MNTEASTIDPDKRIVAPHSQEVEFALLLSKMIDTVKEDPEQLRLTIYDFARTKLKNDLSWADEEERKRLLGALENAIIGVEQFSQRPTPPRQPQLPGFSGQSAESASRIDASSLRWIDPEIDTPPDARFGSGAKAASKRATILRNLPVFLMIVIVTASALGAFYLQRRALLRDSSKVVRSDRASGAAKTDEPAANSASAAKIEIPSPPPKPSFPVPSVYGVYALHNDTVSELEALSTQVPDRRVAVSTPITSPSRTILPDGDIKFIVFRRDIAASAPEKVDVRVIAQVMRAIAFDASGKRSITPVSDAWSIRNISHVFRVRPIPGNSEMVLIQPENATASLPPGRYALALQGQAYDFAIAGQIKDVNQCLERTEAANGTFYSECQEIRR
jgi:hypothetical protein